MHDKIVLPDIFSAYTKGEYEPYKDMYTNLHDTANDTTTSHVVMALRVGDSVLTGKELMKWFQTECHGRTEEFLEKVKLHSGEREAQFDFGERRVRQEIVVPNVDVISRLNEKIASIEEEMTCVSLILEKRRLEETIEEKDMLEAHEFFQNLDALKKDKEDLKRIEATILSFMTPERMKEEESKSSQELHEELLTLHEQEMACYKGDITLLQECYGISNEMVDERIKQKIAETMGVTKEDETPVEAKGNRPKLTNAQKNAQSALMGVVKGKTQEKELLSHIIAGKLLSSEEISSLARIVPEDIIDNYQQKMMIESATPDVKAKKEERVRQHFSKLENNPREYEHARTEAVASILYPDVLDEEVSMLMAAKHHLSVLNAQKNGKEPPEEKKVEDLTLAERKRLEQEVRMEKLAKAQAALTVGISVPTKIHQIREQISHTPKDAISCARFVYGNDWYICADEDGTIIEECMDESAPLDGLSRKTYEEARSEYEASEDTISLLAVKEVIEEAKPSVVQKVLRKI